MNRAKAKRASGEFIQHESSGPWTFLTAIINALAKQAHIMSTRRNLGTKTVLIFFCTTFTLGALVVAVIAFSSAGGSLAGMVKGAIQQRHIKDSATATVSEPGSGSPASNAQSVTGELQSAEPLYKEAVSLMRSGKHADAALRFDEFLRYYANHSSSAMGLYNLAVCYQNLAESEKGTNSLNRAQKTFNRFLDTYPAHQNVSKARDNVEKVKMVIQERSGK